MKRCLLAALLVWTAAAAARAARPAAPAVDRAALHQKVDNLRGALPRSLQPEIDRMTPDYRARFSAAELERLRQAYANEVAVLIQLSVATDSPMRKDDLALADKQFERSKKTLLSLLFKVCASRFPDAAGGIGTDAAASAFDVYVQMKMIQDAEARELLKSGHLDAAQRQRIGQLIDKLSGMPGADELWSAASGVGEVRAAVVQGHPRDVALVDKKAQALTLAPSDFQARVNLSPDRGAVPPPPQEIEAVLRGRGATREMIRAIMAASRKTGIDPLLIGSFMSSESGFQAGDTNPKSGASGLMQLMPETARSWGVRNIYSIPANIMAGSKQLKYLQGLIAVGGTDFTKDDLRTARRYALGRLAEDDAAAVSAKVVSAFASVRELFDRARPVLEQKLAQMVTDAEFQARALAASKGWSVRRTRRAVAAAVVKARDQAVQAVFKDSVIDSVPDEVKYVIGAYNAGEGRIKQYGGLPPFAETQRYVPRVIFRYFTSYVLAAEQALGVATFKTSASLDPAG